MPHTLNAGKVEEIRPGKTKRVKAPHGWILVCNVDGHIYAVDDLCTHEDASLYLGCLKGHLIQCSLHGGKFDVRTGAAVEEPAEQPLRTYPVTLTDGEIHIEVPA